jgi:hypothetical protein
MRIRIVVVILAACMLCPVSRALAQWTPRRVVRAPLQRGPVRHPSYYAQRGPVQFRRANASGPITKQHSWASVGNRQSAVDWRDAEGAPSVDYRSFDYITSDAVTGYGSRNPGF